MAQNSIPDTTHYTKQYTEQNMTQDSILYTTQHNISDGPKRTIFIFLNFVRSKFFYEREVMKSDREVTKALVLREVTKHWSFIVIDDYKFFITN